ncbi:MAG: ChbG/HpnK family deacetylase [Bradyrhizobiaceae bacterium]|nr:ChbG/HpnK family deacetylase [Bradyrhizobiaceae bacterium]
MAENRQLTVFAGDNSPQRRRIWLCADDYGISTSVNAAICDLVMRGRLNATSVIVVAPSFQRSEALRLLMLNVGADRVAIGLHLTLTAPFRPLSAKYEARYPKAFLPLKETMVTAFRGRFDVDAVAAEVAMQIKAFLAAFGRLPDFVDGHQHVHLLPQIRDVVLRVVRQFAPNAWVRQCGRAVPLLNRFGDRKGLFLDMLSRGFRARAAECGVATNAAFAGTYNFRADTPFAKRFRRFLTQLPDRSVVMCHPGFVDSELKQLDPLTGPREHEYAFFVRENFPRLLHSHGVVLV